MIQARAAPDGTPDTLLSIVPGDPLSTAIEIVDVAEPPWATLRPLGSAAIEKSFGCTVSGSAAQSLELPSVLEFGSPLYTAAHRSPICEVPKLSYGL